MVDTCLREPFTIDIHATHFLTLNLKIELVW